MSDVPIPEDIRAAAEALVTESMANPGIWWSLSETIARAMYIERARCAKIADIWDPSDSEIAQYSHGSHYIAGLCDAGERIAASIRRGTP
jgi:hypothetical protein